MSTSRKRRRRVERAREKREHRHLRLSPQARLTLVALGAAAITAGGVLLGHGDPVTVMRLGRVAGILILVGAVVVGIGAWGRV
jgi:hypothetical protein